MQEVLEKYTDVDDDGIFSQYVECMRNLIARLILESYDMAAYVYQKYCVEKQSVEELLKNTRLSEQELNMFISYFDVRETEQYQENNVTVQPASHSPAAERLFAACAALAVTDGRAPYVK